MDNKNYTYKICKNLANIRLDKMLVELLKGDLSSEDMPTRVKLQSMIENDLVKVNGFVIKQPSYKTKENDEIVVFFQKVKDAASVTAQEMKIDIVYQDEYLAVINKQAGLVVHPGAGNLDNTLANGLVYLFGDKLSSVNGDFRPGIIHRLDKDTTGLMVVAKGDFAHNHLSSQLASREMKRVYNALIWGVMNPSSGTIYGNITRSSRDHTRMQVVLHGGKEAVTHYETAEVFCNGSFSLVECKLETGRTHQIRVHFSHNRHSLVGDQTYGHNNRKISSGKFSSDLTSLLNNFTRQALHSKKISFRHPKTEEIMSFSCEMPEDMLNLIKLMK